MISIHHLTLYKSCFKNDMQNIKRWSGARFIFEIYRILNLEFLYLNKFTM
jgi:hypothetical protein